MGQRVPDLLAAALHPARTDLTSTNQPYLNDMLNYLQTGQQASQLSGNLGQQGVNQLSQGLGGILSLLMGGGSGGGGTAGTGTGGGGLSSLLGTFA